MIQHKVLSKKKKKVWLPTTRQHCCMSKGHHRMEVASVRVRSTMGYYSSQGAVKLLVKFATEATIKRWFTFLFVIVFQFFKGSDLSCVFSSENQRHLNGMNTETDVSRRLWDVVNPAAPKLTKTMRNVPWISTVWLHFLRHASPDEMRVATTRHTKALFNPKTFSPICSQKHK